MPKKVSSTAQIETCSAAQSKSELQVNNDDERASSVPSAQEFKEQNPRRQMSGVRWISIVIMLLVSMFLFALDNTIVAVAQPKIVDDFGHLELLPWVSVAYALGAIAINLFL